MGNTRNKYFTRKQRVHYRNNLTLRNREIRDLYNKLMKKYKVEYVLDFFATNYFINEGGIQIALRNIDKEPVDLNKASIQYLTAIKEDFNL